MVLIIKYPDPKTDGNSGKRQTNRLYIHIRHSFNLQSRSQIGSLLPTPHSYHRQNMLPRPPDEENQVLPAAIKPFQFFNHP